MMTNNQHDEVALFHVICDTSRKAKSGTALGSLSSGDCVDIFNAIRSYLHQAPDTVHAKPPSTKPESE